MDRLDGVAATSETATNPFVGRWQGLISTTNWEKGRIICEWRNALIASDAPSSEYSDEVWSRLVGGVTSQHVGRLRRVHDRFGDVVSEYEGLYWSHFHAAFDWDDAEMWLEGALQNSWSVSRMRRQRWETLGSLPNDEPNDTDVVSAETDEDFPPDADADTDQIVIETVESVDSMQDTPAAEAKSKKPSNRSSAAESSTDATGAAIFSDDPDKETAQFVRPFEKLAELPDDIAEAFDAYKLAILRHKMDNWSAVSRDDVLASLEALKELSLAPSPS